jgi:ribosomal protein S18 acetylase RimI-like enzyme
MATPALRRGGCGKVPRVTVHVEVLREVTDEVVEAFARLTPQLSSSADPPDREALTQIVGWSACTLLIAWSGDQIAGTLTLVMFPIPTGFRAWIEDVIVDEAARGQGIGEILTNEALSLAQAAGAKTVDLTSRPSRQAAGRLYERVGFQSRDTRLYRYTFGPGG